MEQRFARIKPRKTSGRRARLDQVPAVRNIIPNPFSHCVVVYAQYDTRILCPRRDGKSRQQPFSKCQYCAFYRKNVRSTLIPACEHSRSTCAQTWFDPSDRPYDTQRTFVRILLCVYIIIIAAFTITSVPEICLEPIMIHLHCARIRIPFVIINRYSFL